jgi:2-oxoisovalerate dehydrogenase E1 component
VGVHGKGKDIAILTFANGAYLSRQAQADLAAQGVNARVIDMRWLVPLPEEAILDAIKGCKAVLVVDETRRTGGVAEAVMAMLAEKVDVSFARLTADDSFIPTGPAYAATMPSRDTIAAAATALLEKVK